MPFSGLRIVTVIVKLCNHIQGKVLAKSSWYNFNCSCNKRCQSLQLKDSFIGFWERVYHSVCSHIMAQDAFVVNAHRNAHGRTAASQMSSLHVVLTPGLPRVSEWVIIQRRQCCIVPARANGVVSWMQWVSFTVSDVWIDFSSLLLVLCQFTEKSNLRTLHILEKANNLTIPPQQALFFVFFLEKKTTKGKSL